MPRHKSKLIISIYIYTHKFLMAFKDDLYIIVVLYLYRQLPTLKLYKQYYLLESFTKEREKAVHLILLYSRQKKKNKLSKCNYFFFAPLLKNVLTFFIPESSYSSSQMMKSSQMSSSSMQMKQQQQSYQSNQQQVM